LPFAISRQHRIKKLPLILLPESSWFYQLAKLQNHAPLNFHFCRINIGAVGATAESKTEHPNKSDFANCHWAQAALCQGSWEGDACTSGA
jgi:hypothetical protein